MLPSTVLEFLTPFKKLYNKPPNLDHLRIFGGLCYGKKLDPQNKFDERYLPSVFMGYSNVNLKTKTFYYSRDIAFLESVFPF